MLSLVCGWQAALPEFTSRSHGGNGKDWPWLGIGEMGWIRVSKLRVNPDETEVLLIGPESGLGVL